MSNGSPSVYLQWAILACIFFIFLLGHIWGYDGFRCLRWDAGRQPGAFKRVMTYSYLATLPLLVVFSVAMTVVKYKEGYLAYGGMIMPKPFEIWDHHNRRWILPLYFVLSIAWSLELVTHLEELTFWLFLLHQGPSKREWFHSWEFRTWYLGSMTAILGMPLTTLVSRQNLDTCEAWIFLVGSSASTSTTICFIYVLARFPSFIRHVKSEGAEPDVVVRLSTFYQLNLIRVVFRFMFTVPLFILAIDGLVGPHLIVSDPFWSDFLLMIGGTGCFVSSAITLLIFFPRSITREAGYQTRDTSNPPPRKSSAVAPPIPDYHVHMHTRRPSSPKSPRTQASIAGTQLSAFHYPLSDANSHTHYDATPEYEYEPEPIAYPLPIPRSSVRSDETMWDRHEHPGHATYPYAPHRPTKVMMPIADRQALEEDMPPPSTTLHPYLMTFTSPIDLLDEPPDDDTYTV